MRYTICSLLLLAILGCGKGPIVTVCLSDPKAGGFQCRDHNQKAFFKPYGESENFVATTPEDFKVLLEWVKRNTK